LPLHGAGPERNLLTYVVLLLPYAGYFFTRLFQAPRLGNPVYAIFATSLLLALGTFDITRAFNYPAKKYNREAFAAGWTLRVLQEIEAIPDDGKIIIEKRDNWIPSPIMVPANKLERFVRLDEGNLGKACIGDLHLPVCKKQLFDASVNLIILSSPEKVRSFQEMFTGRSWQIGKFHIFEVNAATNNSERIDSNLSFSRSR
jgi:hypothetical protein